MKQNGDEKGAIETEEARTSDGGKEVKTKRKACEKTETCIWCGHVNRFIYLKEDEYCENCGHMLYGSNTHIDYAYRENNSAIY